MGGKGGRVTRSFATRHKMTIDSSKNKAMANVYCFGFVTILESVCGETRNYKNWTDKGPNLTYVWGKDIGFLCDGSNNHHPDIPS